MRYKGGSDIDAISVGSGLAPKPCHCTRTASNKSIAIQPDMILSTVIEQGWKDAYST